VPIVVILSLILVIAVGVLCILGPRLPAQINQRIHQLISNRTHAIDSEMIRGIRVVGVVLVAAAAAIGIFLIIERVA